MIAVETRMRLLWSGDNPIILLKPGASEKETSAVGLFRVDYSPAGSGNAVFIASELGKPDEIFACYADNAPMAEWIRDTTIGTLPEFKNYDLRKVPIKIGRFASLGNALSSWTELVSTADGEIRLTWAELAAPFNLRVPVGAVPSIPYEINTVIYPAGNAEVIFNGRSLPGRVFPDVIGSQPHSTAFLALSETWYY